MWQITTEAINRKNKFHSVQGTCLGNLSGHANGE